LVWSLDASVLQVCLQSFLHSLKSLDDESQLSEMQLFLHLLKPLLLPERLELELELELEDFDDFDEL